jgi:hypothetical protein
MKPLAFLLGAQALDLASSRSDHRPAGPEPELPPLASTPETAAAWRRWAAAGRVGAIAAAGVDDAEPPIAGSRRRTAPAEPA